jgi:hypothetical protein
MKMKIKFKPNLKQNSNKIIENKIHQTNLKIKFIKQNSNEIEHKIQTRLKMNANEIKSKIHQRN